MPRAFSTILLSGDAALNEKVQYTLIRDSKKDIKKLKIKKQMK